jgi:hypothetical protein
MPDGYLVGPGLAGRIRDTIRTVDSMQAGEGEPPTLLRTTFDEPTGPPRFRIGTFGTAAWSLGSANTVTLSNVGVTGYTVLATNVFGSLPAAGSTQTCAIAKDGTAWYLIQPTGQNAVGYTSSAWAKGTTQSIQIYAGVLGGESPTGTYITAYNGFAAIGSSKRVIIARTFGDNWHVISAECS